MFEEERRDIREEKAMASIPEGMLELAVLAENAQVPAEGSPLPPAQGAEGGSPGIERRSAAPISADEVAAETASEEAMFPEEPFEESLHKPRLIGTGKAKGRRLVKPEESVAAVHDARAAAVDPRHLAAERSARWRLRRPGGRIEAHALRLEEEVRRARTGRVDGPAAARPQGEPHAGTDQADDPHAQAVESRVGLPADQRHAPPRAGAAGLSDGRGAGAARGGLPDGRGDHPSASRQAAAVRAGHAQSALADRPVHLRAEAAESPRVHGGFHGRPQPVHHRLTDSMPANRRPWSWRSCGRRSSPTARPQEMLTDNGSQYVTWRGTSAFHREMDQRGIKHIVAKPQRPQTLGKIERFWGTLWRECIETAVFLDLEDARRRIGHFIDYYNFQRPHQGIDGLVPADRFFGAASEVLATLRKRVAANALELARNGVPKAPFYVTGRIGERAFSVHAEGERMILKREGEERTEVDLGRARRCGGAADRRRRRLQGCGNAAAGLSRWLAVQRLAAGGGGNAWCIALG